MANTPVPEEETSGVKSYEAPERKGMPVGRIVTIVVVALLIILLLNWLF